MKKITLFLSLILCAMITTAQTNLLTNGSFEEWSGGKPTGWGLVGAPSGYTATEESTIVLDGTKSIKVSVPSTASGTISWTQSISSLTPGQTYTLSMSYYIESGDGSDARIWCNFKNGDDFFVEADLVATGQYAKLRGPGNANSSGNSYFTDEKGEWKTYTVDVTIPSNADGFDFQFRTYKKAVVYWDKFSFIEKISSSSKDFTINNPLFYLSGNALIADNVADGTVIDIYNALGAKVQTGMVNAGMVDLDSYVKGIYIIKVGNYTQKIMF